MLNVNMCFEFNFTEEILNICPHFDLLHEIYGGRVVSIHNNNVPCQRDSTQIQIGTPNSTNNNNHLNSIHLDIEDDLNDDDDDEDDDDGIILDHVLSPTLSIPSTMSNPSSSHRGTKRGNSDSDLTTIVTKRQDVHVIDGEEVQVESDRMELEKEKMKMEERLQTRQLDLEQQQSTRQLDLEEKRSDNKLIFKREQLAFEREKYFRDKDMELEKFKIEQEMKLQIEMAKIQNKIIN
jgi:hypothetical protein